MQRCPDPALPEVLGRFRAESGLSFSLLSDRAGVDVKYLHDLETGRKNKPSRDVLIRVAIGLGLDVSRADELLTAAGHLALLRQRSAAREPAAI